MYITIDGFEQLTAQEVFDISANHLMIQNQKALQCSDICSYGNAQGLKCAAGVFIKEHAVSSADEVGNWEALVEGNFVVAHNSELILALQKVHDQCQPFQWADQLAVIAKFAALNLPRSVRNRLQSQSF